MDAQSRDKLLYFVIATLGLFLVGRFLGMGPLESVWSFAHWGAISTAYLIIMILGTAAAAAVCHSLTRTTISGRVSGLVISVILLAGLVVFWLFRTDALVYGGGNLRVAQIAQAEVIVVRWFEYGVLTLVTWLFGLFRSFDVPVLYAAGNAWQALAVLSAFAAGVGAIRLATLLNEKGSDRILYFLIIFLGGTTLLYFGFVGIEVVVAPIVIWFAAVEMSAWRNRSARDILILWGLTLLGIVLLFPLLFLIPAAVYFTLAAPGKRQDSRGPLIAGLITLVVIIAGVYWQASQVLEMQIHLLFSAGKMPFSDYGLFSLRHISDWLQIIFLGAPLILVGVAASFLAQYDNKAKVLVTGLWLLAVCGLVAVFILDPVHSPVLDFPRFAAYLAPVSVLVATLLAMGQAGVRSSRMSLAVAAVLSLLVPLAVLPVYRELPLAESYSHSYLQSHDAYYRTAAVAFRDNYFYVRNWEEVTRWERLLPVYSPDQMNLRGTGYLADHQEYEDALTVQYRIIAKFPFWAEPRGMAAVNQMKLGRFQLAKPQLDTAIMLEPYRKEHWVNLYAYYRDMQNYSEAMKAILRAESIAPSDIDIQTDKMIITYRIGDLAAAESHADALLARDSTRPFPYLIKAFVADKSQNPRGAVWFYQKFVELGPKEPEVPRVETRINALKLALGERPLPVDSATATSHP